MKFTIAACAVLAFSNAITVPTNQCTEEENCIQIPAQECFDANMWDSCKWDATLNSCMYNWDKNCSVIFDWWKNDDSLILMRRATQLNSLPAAATTC